MAFLLDPDHQSWDFSSSRNPLSQIPCSFIGSFIHCLMHSFIPQRFLKPWCLLSVVLSPGRCPDKELHFCHSKQNHTELQGRGHLTFASTLQACFCMLRSLALKGVVCQNKADCNSEVLRSRAELKAFCSQQAQLSSSAF